MKQVEINIDEYFDEIRESFIKQCSWCDDGVFFLDKTECIFYYDKNISELLVNINEISKELWK